MSETGTANICRVSHKNWTRPYTLAQ